MTNSTLNLDFHELNNQIRDLKTRLDIETELRKKAELDLKEQTRKVEELEKQLDAARKQSLAAHMAQEYRDMGPGEALIATVAAPLMAAPMAVTTVVKGFESVGNGIVYMFTKKKKEEGAGEGAVPTPTPAAGSAGQ